MTSSAEAMRAYRGPALFERGFRPFFLGAGLFAALGLPLWLAMLSLGLALPTHLGARDWHVHEMVFGYGTAVIAGFLLTAIPNWTGRLPVAGPRLAALASLWLAGRVAMAVSAWAPVPAALVDAAFPAALAAVAWREVVAGRNRRNAVVCALVTLLALANAGFHVAVLAAVDRALAERAGLSAIVLLISLIGGRIVPSFTRNWLAARGAARLPAPFGAVDKAALAIVVAALAAWVAAPDSVVATAAMALAAVALALRLARWRGAATAAEPLVTILHVGYAWLPLWFALTALHGIAPAAIDASTALHALTAGAIGTMTLAVMTRATLGHSGRPLAAGGLTALVYLLVVGGAALRVLAPLLPLDHGDALALSGLVWSAGFAAFAIGYAPLFLKRRA
ncbi:MAG: NnrS family protein [Alphaproteobacteria bacterium]